VYSKKWYRFFGDYISFVLSLSNCHPYTCSSAASTTYHHDRGNWLIGLNSRVENSNLRVFKPRGPFLWVLTYPSTSSCGPIYGEVCGAADSEEVRFESKKKRTIYIQNEFPYNFVYISVQFVPKCMPRILSTALSLSSFNELASLSYISAKI
jgi:hypothetical protein